MKARLVLAVEDKWHVYYTNYMEFEVIMLCIIFVIDQFQNTWAIDKFGIIISKPCQLGDLMNNLFRQSMQYSSLLPTL